MASVAVDLTPHGGNGIYTTDRVVLNDPVRRLMLAVLVQAWRDLLGVNVEHENPKRLRASALSWLNALGRGRDRYLFSFELICDTIGIDSGRARESMLKCNEGKMVQNNRVTRDSHGGQDV